MSNTGWTPAVPGPANEFAGTEDAVAEQVIDITVERVGEATVVRVCGEIDMLTTPMLSSSIAEQFESNPAVLVLDLSGVHFLGSSGLAALVTARDEAERRNLPLRLVSDGHAVLRPLTATGLTELFSIYGELSTALEG